MTDENEIAGLVESNTVSVDAPVAKKSRKSRKQKTKLKARTLEEFKNWLEGLEEFQNDGWIPNAEQWETIKGSIYLIKEEEYYDEPVTYSSAPAPAPVYQQPQQHIVNSVPAPVQDAPLTSAQIDEMVNRAKNGNVAQQQSSLIPSTTPEPTGTGDEFI